MDVFAFERLANPLIAGSKLNDSMPTTQFFEHKNNIPGKDSQRY